MPSSLELLKLFKVVHDMVKRGGSRIQAVRLEDFFHEEAINRVFADVHGGMKGALPIGVEMPAGGNAEGCAASKPHAAGGPDTRA